jgi:hypothetical protein
MSCRDCKKTVRERGDEERDKVRAMARRIAEIDGKTQVILEHGGRLSITCEECWIRGGRAGRALEYVIV